MDNLLQQIDFGNEAGDDVDPIELSSYFVEQSMFTEFLNQNNKVLIATAKKGVGKSALLQWILHKTQKADPNAIVIKCRGADIVRSKFKLTSERKTPNDHINDWMVRICTIVNRELALRIKLALTDDQITLIESAEVEGYKSRNLIGCLLDRFQKTLGRLQPQKSEAADEIQLLKRVKDRKVWILIDDLDATFQKTNSELMELSTFFTACRYLAQDLKDVNIRVTMRADVWPMIRRFDESLDKLDQYVKEISWNVVDFRRLLYMRVKSQIEKLRIKLQPPPTTVSIEEKEEYLINYVFTPKMAWGDKNVFTYRVIYTLSYERPRWAIQLCKLAQKNAFKHHDLKISRSHIDSIWGEYGNKRIADLVSEHKHQCRQIEELITAFRGCERQMKREELFSLIKKRVSTHLEPIIEGVATRSPREIAHFLYRLGFLIARSEEADGSYEHYHFSEMPDFLTTRTNADFGVVWEIHPCYREALDIKKINKSHRTKFTNRTKFTRRRDKKNY